MQKLSLRQPVIVFTVVACVVYLVYRLCFTFNLTTPYAIGASLALYIAELFTGVLLLLFLLQVWRLEEPPEQPVLPDRTIDVFVPTYNEDVDLLRITLRACVAMDYPHRTYLLDDGGTEARLADPEKGPPSRARADALKAMCAELGVTYLTRPDNKHAKAGNMNAALKKTDGEFIVILDADHVPDRNFITRMLGYFSDEQLAYVQSPHAFYNFDSYQARYDPVRASYWEEGQLFYDVIQPGRNRWNAAIFAGAAAMFRRKALDEIGGFAQETITEDLHTGLRLHARGWKSLAISDRLISGQAAPDVTTFHSQRLRWGEGNLSIFAYDNPLTTRGLTLAQRLCYLGSMIHWAGGPFLLLIYLTPLLMLFSSVPPVARFEWIFATLIVVYIGASYISFRLVSRGYGSFWNSQIYSMTNVWTSTRSVLRALFLRRFQTFVVTSKRGRQSKSVLPYLWPHATFFLASVLALVWGWYRPISGVSDDYYKPILASVWAVFHLSVALVIIRRGLWPAERRFAYRHVVSLPASLTVPEGGPEHHAVTIDLNDAGVCLLTYEPIAAGSRFLVTIRGGGAAVRCLAEVRRCEELDARLRAGARGVRAYRCGLVFVEPGPAEVDLLNQFCWHYAVPFRYAQFDRNRRGRPAAPALRLPVLLSQPGAVEPTWYTVTEDLSSTGLTALLDAEVAVGTEVRFRMPTPGEEVLGVARVVEAQPKTLAARTYHQCRFEFMKVESGWTTLGLLLKPADARRLRPLLRPRDEPRRVPVLRPALIGLLLLAILTPITLGLFHMNFRDELFLDRLADAPLPISPAQEERLLAIFQQTLDSHYPSNDRLVLLENALLHTQKLSEAAQVIRVLAKRDLDNLSLQLAYAQALDDMGEPSAGLEEYRKLLTRIEKGDFPGQSRAAVLLAAARTAVHAHDYEQAIPWYREVLASSPDVTVRNELAGVLLSASQPEEAVALFPNRPNDWDGLVLLTKAHLLAGSYSTAEKEARALLERRPGDLDAQLLLLDALGMQRNLAAARELGNELIENHPHVPRIRIRGGRLALSLKRYLTALLLFQGLLEDGTDLGQRESEVRKGFINAAAAVDEVDRINPVLVSQLAQAAAAGKLALDTAYLGRLAWVCQRLKKLDQAAALLRRALDLGPHSADARQRYVGVLLAAGRSNDALQYLEGLEPTPDVRSLLLDVLFHKKDYAAIERISEAALRANPVNSRARLALAQVALTRKDRARAEQLLEEVRRLQPQSWEVRTWLANLELWAGNGAAALAEFRDLLAKEPDQQALWSGFVDAAAAAPKLTADDARVIRSIAEASAATGTDVLFLSRLAWSLHRLKEPTLCNKVLDRALAQRPTSATTRKELAGVLAAAGRYKDALALYQGLPLDAEERRHLARLYEAASDFAGAAAQYRLILETHPDDQPALERLGLVLSWMKDYPGAITAYERLARLNPTNPAWVLHLAEWKLWSGDAAGALAAYSQLLERDPRQPKLWHGFVDAAGLVPKLGPAQAQLAKRIGREVLARPANDPLLLSRLAWVLVRAGAIADAESLLDRADELSPREPAVRKELAGVFAAVGRFRRAIELFEGLEELTFEDRLRLVEFYNGARDFASAEAECRKLLKKRPGDPRVELMLADILSWRGKYLEAAALLRRLRQAEPDSTALALRQARVELWGRNYTAAMKHFADLLEDDPNQPGLWADFVAAAAAAPSLDRRYRKTLLGLATKTLADKTSTDPQFLSRLAQALRTLDEPARAATLLRRAVKADPTSRTLKLQLAQALYDAGRYAEARRYFRALLPSAER
jgi:cellulose synthase/poly-beta-1,6-N-acetylglucosamine synthase-like glycosyltransferase/tetratricopeptide (TPR) repeat protein